MRRVRKKAVRKSAVTRATVRKTARGPRGGRISTTRTLTRAEGAGYYGRGAAMGDFGHFMDEGGHEEGGRLRGRMGHNGDDIDFEDAIRFLRHRRAARVMHRHGHQRDWMAMERHGRPGGHMYE